jgi:hypothetical protein
MRAATLPEEQTVSKRSSAIPVAVGATVPMSHGKIFKIYELALAAHANARLGAHAQHCSHCGGWHSQPNAPTILFPARAWFAPAVYQVERQFRQELGGTRYYITKAAPDGRA